MSRLIYVYILIFAFSPSVRASDIFEFFEAEAEAMQLVTASRLPLSLRRAPATVYVITAADIEATGLQTLWDILRNVPGVDVMNTRTFYGEVSIRGLNKALNNRTLVLLDGKPVLNGPFDSTFWEGIPVTTNAIDRIEVVLGPGSALYGANAINGVINIITKTADRTRGGRLTYAGGQRRTHLANGIYANNAGKLTYLTGASLRTTNQFENADQRASQVGKLHAQTDVVLTQNTKLSLSGGLSDFETQFAVGVSKARYEGTTQYVQANLHRKKTRLRAYWNREQTTIRDINTSPPEISLDTQDITLEHSLSLTAQSQTVVGGGFRRNVIRSNAYVPNRTNQTFWALFAEHVWRTNASWTLVVSSRLDHHPLNGWVFSPRASLVYSPTSQHVFRLSAGTAFRNPTLTESYAVVEQSVQTPFNVPLFFEVTGNTDLDPEHTRQIEVAHHGFWGRLHTTAAGFHYRLKNMIGVGPFSGVPEDLPQLRARAQYINILDDLRAWGGELQAEFELMPGLKLFSHYSYQRIRGILEFQVAENGGPLHKLSGGVHFQHAGLSTMIWAHWIDHTAWSDASATNLSAAYTRIRAYTLVNTHIFYAFSNSLDKLRVGLQISNLLNTEHAETLPPRSPTEPGLSGEILKRRILGLISYRF